MDALTQLKIQIAIDGGVNGVYELMKKCYSDGYNKGRQEAINQIFTFNPEQDL